MAKQINPIETAVAEYLKAQGITFAAVLTGSGKRDDWECDSWSVSFSRDKKERFVTDYHTGIGHRQSKRPMPPEIARLGQYIQARVWWERDNLKPVTPQAASVLYSVLRDAEGAEQNFLDWCGDYGYDNDSMKAHKVYTACCELLQKVRAFFTNEERQAMLELLQDY
ncbi:hypothetical protein [Pseudomonas phage COT4]|uniref:Uncharacterized protein n=1 Tax=Pseudomonas phage M5.1 TaxID=2873460 RepID=A0AAE8XEB0_9CAUD|nr:hypothetical protein QGX13_gp058 [Pseudomonas phage M5.1]UAV89765.1 hypothetical protein M51_184 [Pseudomonas phage M5.1]UGL61364.1 hypothetical protein [Pseudomonas phage COT4]